MKRVVQSLVGFGLLFGLMSCSGLSLTGQRATKLPAEQTIQLIPMPGMDEPTANPVQLSVTRSELEVTATLSVKENISVGSLLYELNYDFEQLSVAKVEIENLLHPTGEPIELYVTRTGFIAIGAVSPELSPQPLEAGTVFAQVTFTLAPTRSSLAYSAKDAGLKLRSNSEFVNADVPLGIERATGTNIIDLAWEEGLDGDYDHNAETNISDLTPIGQSFAQFLTFDSNPGPASLTQDNIGTDGTPVGFYINRVTNGPAHLRIRNIGQKAHEHVGNHGTTTRYIEGGTAPLAYVPGVPPPTGPLYQVGIAMLTAIGENYRSGVSGGYQIHICTCAPGQTPEQGFLVGGEPRTDPTWRVNRPNTLNEQIGALGMGDNLNGVNPSKSYRDFCQQDCTGSRFRLGSAPEQTEFRMYRKLIDTGQLTPGRSFAMLQPLPGPFADPLDDTPEQGENFGAYTYIELTNSVSAPAPTNLDWGGGVAGIRDLQLGETTEWPAGGRFQPRVRFDPATLVWSGNPEPNWEVRYSIFFSDNLTDLWNADNSSQMNGCTPVNARKYYPNPNNTPRVQLFDMTHPGAGQFIELVNALQWASPEGGPPRTMYFGVRAYAYGVYQLSGGGQSIRRVRLDTNVVNQSEVMPEVPPLEDLSQPEGIQTRWGSYPFTLAYIMSSTATLVDDGNGGSYQGFFRVPLVRAFHGQTQTANSSYECFYAGAAFQADEMLDKDKNDFVRTFNNNSGGLELRAEIYRTALDFDTLKAQVETSGFVPWRNANLNGGYPAHLDLFAVTTAFPRGRTGGFTVEWPYLGDPDRFSKFTWFDSQFGNVLNMSYCPRLPGAMGDGTHDWFLEDIYNGITFTDSNGNPYPTIGVNWGFYESARPDDLSETFQVWTDRALPDNQFAWSQFGVNNNKRCETFFTVDDFGFNESALQFVADPFHDQLLIEGRPYNYFTVLAINDEADNCSYAPFNLGDAVNINWHGAMEPGVLSETVTGTSYEDYRDWEVRTEYMGQTNIFTDYWPEVGRNASTGSPRPLARYPSIALNPVTQRVGISYFDAARARVLVDERNGTVQSGTFGQADTASEGPTSLSYDSQGNPHVAYLRLSGDPLSPGGGNHTTSSAPTGGIYYRKRLTGTWQDRELVDNRGMMNSADFALHLLSSNNVTVPYCIGPTVGQTPLGALGVPGLNLRNGGGWSTSALETGASPTNQQLDSIQVPGQNGLTTTYIAIFDSANGRLLLGQLNNLGGWMPPIVLDASEVKGYPAMVRLPSGDIGIAYMAGSDNHLRYGVWNGSQFSVQYNNNMPNSGYQTAITYDQDNQPVILSIMRQPGLLLYTGRKSTGRWFSMGWTKAAASDDLIDANTISVTRNAYGIYAAFIDPLGHLGVISRGF
jgi:hypothetical protein